MYQSGKFVKLILPIMLLALAAHAGNIAGKWSGIIEIDEGGSGAKIDRPLELSLEQKDGVLSGRIGLSGDSEGVEIRNAKAEGDKVTFEASSPDISAMMKFSLTIQGEEMHGEMKGVAAGNDLVAKVSLSRVPG
jgi:hypothetical protein